MRLRWLRVHVTSCARTSWAFRCSMMGNSSSKPSLSLASAVWASLTCTPITSKSISLKDSRWLALRNKHRISQCEALISVVPTFSATSFGSSCKCTIARMRLCSSSRFFSNSRSLLAILTPCSKLRSLRHEHYKSVHTKLCISVECSTQTNACLRKVSSAFFSLWRAHVPTC